MISHVYFSLLYINTYTFTWLAISFSTNHKFVYFSLLYIIKYACSSKFFHQSQIGIWLRYVMDKGELFNVQSTDQADEYILLF